MSGGYTYLIPGDRLAQGSKPPINSKMPFEVIVLAAREHQFDMPGYEVLHIPLDDDPWDPPSAEDQAKIKAVASTVAQRVRAGHRVLVTCHAGINRSGLIAGLALVELGFTGPQAANRIKYLRGGLTNPQFRRLVRRAG